MPLDMTFGFVFAIVFVGVFLLAVRSDLERKR